MLSFRDYIQLQEQNSVGRHNDYAGGAYLSSDQTGSEASISPSLLGHDYHLPSLDMVLPNELPFVTKKGKIVHLERTKNPIRIMLSDGTRLYMTYDQFKRIKVEPEIGRQMEVVFQRHPTDHSATPSKIERISVY